MKTLVGDNTGLQVAAREMKLSEIPFFVFGVGVPEGEIPVLVNSGYREVRAAQVCVVPVKVNPVVER
jgi:hypothetical protein